MSNVRMIIDNATDSATITANPAVVATLPASNLADITREKVMRTTSTASQEIKLTWAGPVTIAAAALVRHNLTIAATWRIQLYSDAAWTTQVYDSGAVSAIEGDGWGEFIWGVDDWGSSMFDNWAYRFSRIYFDTTYALSAKITITDTSNTDGYIQASRLFLGPYIEPLNNMEFGMQCYWDEDSAQSRSQGGTLRTDGLDPYRVWQFNLGFMQEVDRAKLMEFARNSGLRNDLFLDCFPDDISEKGRDYAGQVKLTESSKITHNFFNNWVAPLVFKEA